MEDIKIGSDIEVFLQNPDGSFLSAIGLIGGSKEEPLPLEKEGCAIQEDNVALEYNVPAVDLNEAGLMYANIQYVLDTVRKSGKIPEGVQIVCCSSARFSEDQLDNIKAQTFGCEPDFNAWQEGMANERPYGAGNLRSCGGHIHVSYPEATVEKTLTLVRLFDLFLGVPSVLLDPDTDRRRLYGKAGAFRYKQWGKDQGFEYRVLSNFWTKSEELVTWVFNQIRLAFEFYERGEMGVLALEGDIVSAINNSNASLAEVLMGEFGITLPQTTAYAQV